MGSDDLLGAAELLRRATDVTILAHVNPDADALGSALALGTALRRRGVAVRVSFGAPGEVPRSLRGLDSDGLVVPAGAVPRAVQLLVAVDAGSAGRLGRLADRVAATIACGGAVLVIDHHASNTRFGTHHLVDERAEATVVLVARLLDELGVELDERIARCLYAGLVMDTSMFRRATPDTHRLAARLLEAGVDADALTRQLAGSHPFAWSRMLSAVLGRAQLEPDAVAGLGLVHTEVRLADMAGVGVEEVESVVDILRTTIEAEVAVVLKEVAPGRWSGSLRAARRVDVCAAAVALGGGGHRLAAGFTAGGTAEEILAALRAALAQPVLI
ncbi:MAG TPA: DHH family phosphoesterase [Actinophytocola sp.]|uniref:DHH family phosphoesterase n=1 Tax=Actinophytocola sp. TaxID=1872138 RepID=UPI002DBF1667|nr:DHH family phosphoesterase [Actinophytocola sp.]HEU5475019.1 DHH family phosphoesterase [Actinophytocola sp.]